MNLDLFLGGDALLDEELSEVSPEITLQLNDHALLFVLDHGAVAMEHLFEGAEEFLVIEVVGETLHNGDALTCGTLLVVQIYKHGLDSVSLGSCGNS